MSSVTRRGFLQTAATAGAIATLPTRSLLAASANEQVNLGIVGCGWRGGQLANFFNAVPGLKITGLCDVDEDLVGKLGEEYSAAKKWSDMRQMFDSPDIDAVAIATCNHWHCLAAIWAMQAGKHVYVEKPLGHTEWEGQQVVNAQREFGRICQVGTQQRSDPMQAEIKQFLHEDKSIGELQSVRVNRFGVRESIGRRDTPLTIPKNVDYDLWLGPAQDEPLYRNKLHYDWHWDWNTGSGEMGNWGVHILDDVRNNVFQDSVIALRSIAAAGARVGWNDAGNTPNVHFAILDAEGIPVAVTLSNLPMQKGAAKVPGPKSGYIAYCSAGRLEGQRGHAAAFDAEGKKIKTFKGTDGNKFHQKNFVEAIRADKQDMLAAPVHIGNDSTTWCNLINIASRVSGSNSDSFDGNFGSDSVDDVMQKMAAIVADAAGEEGVSQFGLNPTLNYDVATRQFVGGPAAEANQLLRREYRDSFAVPDLSAAVTLGAR